MRSFSIQARTFFLICAGSLFYLAGPEANPRIASISAVLACFFAAAFFISFLLSFYLPASRRKFFPPNIGVLFSLSLLFAILSLRIYFEARAVDPPPRWHSLSGSKPVYNRRILAEARIEKELSPGLYLAKVRMKGMEGRIYINHRRYQKKRKRTRSRYRYRRQYGHNNRRRRHYRKMQFRKSIRWVHLRPEKNGNKSEAIPFLAALRIKNKQYHRGCVLHLKLYGYAAPKKLSHSGYHSFLRRTGARSYANIYDTKRFLRAKCGPKYLRTRIRDQILKMLGASHALSADNFRLARAMIFGESSRLGRSLKQEAAGLNILHLFAASGLHLGIFYAVLFLPAAAIFGRRRPAVLFAPLPLCFAYTWLLYFPVSLSRAFVFLALFSLSSLMNRPMTKSEFLLNVAILLLLIMPFDFFSLSSMLSFAAIAGILYLQPTIKSLMSPGTGKVIGFFKTQLSISLSASLFITPMQLHFFGGYSYGGLIANTILTPAAGLILPLLYIVLGLDFILPPWITGPLWDIVRFMTSSFLEATRTAGPFALYERYDSLLNLPTIANAMLILLLFRLRFLRLHPEIDRIKSRRLFILFYILLALLGPIGAMLSDVYGLCLNLITT